MASAADLQITCEESAKALSTYQHAAFEAFSEFAFTVAKTKELVAQSRVMMAEADALIARR